MTATRSQRQSEALLPGFADPVGGSQAAFRAVMDALARPGAVRSLPEPEAVPEGWPSAAAALALTLFDQDTPVWLDAAARSGEALAWLRFHCGCPVLVEPDGAVFAVLLDTTAAPPLHAFGIGDPLSPEQSATLLLAVESLAGGPSLHWTGPGIRGATAAAPRGLPPDFVRQWADNHALYPSGVDVILMAGTAVVGLPRGVAVAED